MTIKLQESMRIATGGGKVDINTVDIVEPNKKRDGSRVLRAGRNFHNSLLLQASEVAKKYAVPSTEPSEEVETPELNFEFWENLLLNVVSVDIDELEGIFNTLLKYKCLESEGQFWSDLQFESVSDKDMYRIIAHFLEYVRTQ